MQSADEFRLRRAAGPIPPENGSERSAQARTFQVHCSQDTAGDFLLHGVLRHDRDPTFYLYGALHRLDVVELHDVSCFHPVRPQVAVDHLPRREVRLERDELLAGQRVQRYRIAAAEGMAWGHDEDHLVFIEDLETQASPLGRIRDQAEIGIAIEHLLIHLLHPPQFYSHANFRVLLAKELQPRWQLVQPYREDRTDAQIAAHHVANVVDPVAQVLVDCEDLAGSFDQRLTFRGQGETAAPTLDQHYPQALLHGADLLAHSALRDVVQGCCLGKTLRIREVAENFQMIDLHARDRRLTSHDVAAVKLMSKPLSDTSTLADRLLGVQAAIQTAAERSGRSPSSVELIAVSKTQPPEVVQEALDAGQMLFGENRVQEARAKIPLLPGRARWHLIGHLQSNKIRHALALNFELIHGVDSFELAQDIDRVANEVGAKPAILLEVNVAEESTKFGFKASNLREQFESLLELRRLSIEGLMCIPPPVAQAEESRKYFVVLRELRDRLQEEFRASLPTLSMGMSGDYTVAVEEGATLVRVGTAIFGERTGKTWRPVAED